MPDSGMYAPPANPRHRDHTVATTYFKPRGSSTMREDCIRDAVEITKATMATANPNWTLGNPKSVAEYIHVIAAKLQELRRAED
jgi:hypothetical protein